MCHFISEYKFHISCIHVNRNHNCLPLGKGEVDKKGKYKQAKNEASYKKQKKVIDKVNKHTKNLYSAKSTEHLLVSVMY